MTSGTHLFSRGASPLRLGFLLSSPKDGRSGLLQHKCACGGTPGPSGECEECRKKREAGMLQRKSSVSSAGSQFSTEAPGIVHEVLRSPGQPLDAATRALVEPRFNHDFSNVRVHANARASESARAVNSVAYTVGNDVVFLSGHYAPETSEGRWLLSHELAHVIQQANSVSTGGPLRVSDATGPDESAADQAADAVNAGGNPPSASPSTQPLLARRVSAGNVGCTAGTHGAPANPVAALTAADARAQSLAGAAAVLAEAGSAAATMDIDITQTGIGLAYVQRFGLPPSSRRGFTNRLSGRVAPTRNEAISGELEMLSNRLQRISDNFEHQIHYPCIGGPVSMMGCDTHCNGRDASACAGVRAIFLCPGFWNLGENSRATLFIHETAHMLWANVGHSANFRHASCYANFVADILHAPTTSPACPVP